LPKDFKIYYCEKIADEISEHVEDVLNDLYGLQFRAVGVHIPRVNAWDDFSNAYEVRDLLAQMIAERLSFFLWLITEPISQDQKSVFGYAESLKGAIVSSAKMATRTLVAKEAAFFVGIVLGLNPCKNECIMLQADSFEVLINKPSTLCSSCNAQYNRLKLRYM
jgi:archaemetzincin